MARWKRCIGQVKKSEVECLIRIFHSLVERADVRLDNTGLDRNTFRAILHSIFGMTDDMLMNRVFFAFDKDNDNYINVKECVKRLSVFLRGTFEEKLKFCFEVYYFNGDGYISRGKMLDILNSLHQQSPEEETDEGINELVDITLKKMDYDSNGKVSFADFEKAVKEDKLLSVWTMFTRSKGTVPAAKLVEGKFQRIRKETLARHLPL
ncbi:calaxin-like [Balaenoptera ricei]|uniref:calaxin-like n=1 Tax=Balaenoptera ricei TaxID=2746895 RepID=UPI0028BE6DF0|nr:calaxin-like [Balaenoptera ricei]